MSSKIGLQARFSRFSRIFQKVQKKFRKKWSILNPSILGWGWVLDEWYLPILYSGGPIFRKYLSIFCILYGCGGDSPRMYEKSSGITIIIIKKIKTKPGKKKKSREIWWNAPKKFFSAIREKKIFCERNPTACESKKLRTSKFAI